MKNYSYHLIKKYQEILEDGIEVCASCGGANINANRNIDDQDNTKPLDHCFNCDYAEGITLCMPDDLNFYQEAQETLNKIAKGII